MSPRPLGADPNPAHVCTHTGTPMSTTTEDRDGRSIPETCVGCGRQVQDCTNGGADLLKPMRRKAPPARLLAAGRREGPPTRSGRTLCRVEPAELRALVREDEREYAADALGQPVQADLVSDDDLNWDAEHDTRPSIRKAINRDQRLSNALAMAGFRRACGWTDAQIEQALRIEARP